MRYTVLALPLLAAACASLSTPVPTGARLTRSALTVTLSDGQTCLGEKTTATPSPDGWSGHLAGCSQALAYSVRIDPHANFFQVGLEEIFAALGAPEVIPPLGSAQVTDATGRVHVFVSPPAPESDHARHLRRHG